MCCSNVYHYYLRKTRGDAHYFMELLQANEYKKAHKELLRMEMGLRGGRYVYLRPDGWHGIEHISDCENEDKRHKVCKQDGPFTWNQMLEYLKEEEETQYWGKANWFLCGDSMKMVTGLDQIPTLAYNTILVISKRL